MRRGKFGVGDTVTHAKHWIPAEIIAPGDAPKFWHVKMPYGFDTEQWHEDSMTLVTSAALDPKRCTCGGKTVKTTHANYCDSRADATPPFKMPERLSF
jgi:hypothetical protein